MSNLFWLKDKKAKILIIDDEEDVCVYLKSILERTGKFEARATTSPIEGISLAKELRPDLILLDILMPEMDGTKVMELLRQDEVTRDILVVFVSVLAKPEDVQDNAGKIGGHYFIAKPVLKEELVARIERIMEEVHHLAGK